MRTALFILAIATESLFAQNAAAEAKPVYLYYLFAVLGGLLLNFMPCVLPVLSLKAMSIVDKSTKDTSNKNEKTVSEKIRQTLPYTLGVTLTFSAVGGLFLILRASGQAIGWGFQLQNPAFVAAIAILFATMAFNLFGVFEIRAPVLTTRPALGDIMTGIIAVVAATPCTAPFMASALGASLTLPAFAGFLMFPLLGLGMALPFFLFALFPKSGKWIPKPGAWLFTFKGVLGFMMAASALWLVWVFDALTGSAFLLLTAILLVAFALYLWGREQMAPAKNWARVLRYAAILLALGFAFHFTYAGFITKNKKNNVAQGWQPFTIQARDAFIREGTPVFIDFTADWCITCKVNEEVAFTKKTMQYFTDKGVALLRADFTNLDDTIADEITKLGRAGLPVYAFYDRKGSVTLLPQVLTEGLIIRAIDSATH
ncbi:MAG: Thiol:disulfide interchange protein DsbD [Turneriella sp.]|nr:Thiol:disulfide interchange protein DsbD [Turneriella sp.]